MDLPPTSLACALGLAASAGGLALAAARLVRLRAECRAITLRLESLTARVARLESVPSAVTAPAPSRPENGRGSRPRLRPDPPGPAKPLHPTLIQVPNLAAASPPGEPPDLAGMAVRFSAVWEQAASGASAEAIARETGQPVGQVELILGLRRRLSETGSATNRTP
jgi:hypothetical protein